MLEEGNIESMQLRCIQQEISQKEESAQKGDNAHLEE
jgi:hypothetical protein